MKKCLTIWISCLLISSTSLLAEDLEQGKLNFETRCLSCHNIDSKLVGPALQGATERHEMPWLISFVKSSQSMIKGGDKTAIDLFNEYGKAIMPDQPTLSDEEISDIFAYLLVAEQNLKPKGVMGDLIIKRPFEESKFVAQPITFKDWWVLTFFAMIIIITLAGLYFVVKLSNDERLKDKWV